MAKVLIIVDIQNDFLPGGALPVMNGDEIIPIVNQLQDHFDLIVATQDWHPKGHASFASSHQSKEPFDVITLEGDQQTLWPDHCVQGSQGASFSSDLSTNKVSTVFRKGMDPGIDSYSAFYDNKRFKSTGLSDYLKGLGVKKVYVSGLAGDFCVNFSARDSLSEGFDTYLIKDATRPIDAPGFEICLKEFSARGGHVVSSYDVDGA